MSNRPTNDRSASVEIKFRFQPAQLRLMEKVQRGGGTYVQLRAPQCLEIGGQRSGKLISVDELIPTVDGWKRNGDIAAGDILFDERGELCSVLIAHPPQYPKITYKMTFDNGTEVYAGDDHLWRTSTRKERKNAARRTNEWRTQRRVKRNKTGQSINLGNGLKEAPIFGIRTTQEIFDTQRCGAQNLRGKKVDIANHHIDITAPLYLPKADLLIDPYLLGLWLGDGSSDSGIIWGTTEDVLEYQNYLATEKFYSLDRPFGWRVEGLTKRLSILKILGNKHIPQEYLRASVEQRIALLAGLMDSDGSTDGGCEWSNTNKALVMGMCELLSSLGIKHQFKPSQKSCWYKGEQKFSDGWRTSFTTAVSCFKLQRKSSKQKRAGLDGQSLRHRIVKVEVAEPKLMRCLTVDSPSHLYLCSKAMIPTHNTTGKLMHGIIDYCLRFRKCDMLVLRRTISELDNIIQDMKTFVPEDLYTLNQSTRIATFNNGSRIVFAGCANDTERDIEKYLGQAFPYMQVSECAQFSPEIWTRLYARNLVNAGCEPDEHGNLPVPRIVGDTNPIGAHWEFYKTVFVDKIPWEKEEGCRQARDGSWWKAPFEDPERDVLYNPAHYAYNHTTILDNPEYLKRDPSIITRLKSLPKAKREIFLLGRMDGVSGQYFDCWTDDYVVDLREDPEAVIWQTYQPVIGGQDWGVGHHNAFYLLTRALVRFSPTSDYKSRIICFREVAPETTGLTGIEFADLINAAAFYPRLPEDHPQYHQVSGKRCKIAAIYFSHEKFNRVMEAHSPADEYSRLLRERNLPPVSRGTTDRIGSAGYMYDQIKRSNIAILRTCPAIIQAIPSLQRDPKRLDDVLKTNAKADDRYDGFRLCLYGMFKERGEPTEIAEKKKLDDLRKTDPFAAHFLRMKQAAEAKKRTETFVQKEQPTWMNKVRQ